MIDFNHKKEKQVRLLMIVDKKETYLGLLGLIMVLSVIIYTVVIK